jgi:hypothetical protein
MRRLKRFLARFQPDLILLEFSPFARSFRIAHQQTLQKLLSNNVKAAAQQCHLNWRKALAHPEIQAVRRQFALPFEYRAAAGYARHTGKNLLLVDQSTFSRQLIESWSELIGTENLATLLSLPAEMTADRIRHAYQVAHHHVDDAATAEPPILSKMVQQTERAWREREELLARRVNLAMSTLAQGTCVYVGGWRHLVSQDNPPRLRSLLNVSAAQCYLLDAFD